MPRAKIHRLKTAELSGKTLIIGLSCRNPRGFIWMWSQIFSFVLKTKNAPGCVAVLPGLTSPLRILLVSYWENESYMMDFVKSKPHLKWMFYINRHPHDLNLFNETYSSPSAANFINQANGFSLMSNNQEPHREAL